MNVLSYRIPTLAAIILSASLVSACGVINQSATNPEDSTNTTEPIPVPPGAGAMAAASPVIADIQNMENGQTIEVPVAMGFPLLLQVDDPNDWDFSVEQPSNIVTLNNPDKTYEDPYLTINDMGNAVITAKKKSASITITITVLGVAGPETTEEEQSENDMSNIPESEVLPNQETPSEVLLNQETPEPSSTQLP